MSASNPFRYGSTVPSEELIGRDEEIHNIASRIKTGQSVVVSGLPRSGKTSILQYLTNPQTQKELYGDLADKLVFSYLDAFTWDDDFNLTQFWQAAFRPLDEHLKNNLALSDAYEICQRENFGSYVVERFLKILKKESLYLVVMIDEFDTVLNLPLKKHANFFGTIRSLASNSQNGLAIIIAISISQTQLINKIEKTAGTGSPYFNYMTEEIVTGLSDIEIDELLNQSNERFSSQDYHFIKKMAGNHPYLLQMLASCLWELYETPNLNATQRREQAIKDFYRKSESTLRSIWNTWELATQQTLMTVAFVQLEGLKDAFQRQGIDVDSLNWHIPRLKSELELLKKQGIAVEDEKIARGWRIRPEILLHFILDKKLELKYREKLPPEIWKNLLTLSFG